MKILNEMMTCLSQIVYLYSNKKLYFCKQKEYKPLLSNKKGQFDL
jgi:hypothetical protein